MTRAHDAADAIRRMAKQYENMVAAAEILEQIGSLENATTEAVAARVAAEKSRDAAINAQVAAQQSVAAAVEESEKIISEAKKSAATSAQKAKARADEIVSLATEKGEGLIAAAEARAAQINADAIAKQDAAKSATASAASREKDINARIKAAEDELADLQGKIDALKAQAAKLLGG